MTKPLRNGDGRRFDGHEYTERRVDYLSIVPCSQHLASAMRNRAVHGRRDVRKHTRNRHA
jgi:hypothetical protein